MVCPGMADHLKGCGQLRGRWGPALQGSALGHLGAVESNGRLASEGGVGCPHPDPVGAWMVPGSRAGL